MPLTEFPIEDPAPVFDPTLFLAFVAAAVLLAALMFWLGMKQGEGATRGDGRCQEIADAIKKKCTAARQADRHQLIGAATELHRELRDRLGEVLDLSDKIAPLNAELEEALGFGGHGHGHGHGHGEHGAAHGEAHGHGGVGAAPAHSHSAASHVINVTVNGGSSGGDHGGHDDHDEPRHGLDLDRVRLAVDHLADFWNSGEGLRRLKAARRQLG